MVVQYQERQREVDYLFEHHRGRTMGSYGYRVIHITNYRMPPVQYLALAGFLSNLVLTINFGEFSGHEAGYDSIAH